MGQWRVAKIPALHNNPWGVSLRWMFEFVATTKVTMNRPLFCIEIHYHCSTLHASQSQTFSYSPCVSVFDGTFCMDRRRTLRHSGISAAMEHSCPWFAPFFHPRIIQCGRRWQQVVDSIYLLDVCWRVCNTNLI